MKELDYIKHVDYETGANTTIQTYRCLLIKMQSMYDDLLTKYRDVVEQKTALEHKLNLGKDNEQK